MVEVNIAVNLSQVSHSERRSAINCPSGDRQSGGGKSREKWDADRLDDGFNLETLPGL